MQNLIAIHVFVRETFHGCITSDLGCCPISVVVYSLFIVASSGWLGPCFIMQYL